jgi:hypothetical protein
MKNNKTWIVINSMFAFVSAFIFAKAIIALARFFVIRHFEGSTQMDNFELDCVTWKYSPFWTHTSVISIYLTGFFISLAMVFIAYFMYRYFRTNKGFLKLWFAWLYVISINQSVGLFLRDIPFKRDIYHALNWMYIPYGVMFTFAILTVIILYFTNIGNEIKFLRMTTSYDDILSNKLRSKLYTRIALLPAIFGSAFLLLIHFYNIQLFEITELVILIASIGLTYISFMKGELIVEFRIVKGEMSNKFNLFVLILFVLSLTAFFYFTETYY